MKCKNKFKKNSYLGFCFAFLALTFFILCKGYKMKFGKYLFESFKEFQEIKNEAIKVGAITAEQFFNFLGSNYSHKLIKN